MEDTTRDVDFDIDLFLYNLAIDAMDNDAVIIRITQSQLPFGMKGQHHVDRVFRCRKYKVIRDEHSSVSALELFGATPLMECYLDFDTKEPIISWGEKRVHFLILNPTNVEIIDLTSKEQYDEGEERPFKKEQPKEKTE